MQVSEEGEKLVAIDIGAESGRIIVGNFDGERLELTETHRFPSLPIVIENHLHTDVNNIWHNIEIGLKKSAMLGKSQLLSIGVDTWGVDFALLDANHELLANPYHYRDKLTDGILDDVKGIISLEEIYMKTGNQIAPFNSLFQLYASKLHNPQLIDQASKMVMLPDLFHYWLCGEIRCEYTNATTTQCFDQINQCWAADLLCQLGIPYRLFQTLAMPGTQLGRLKNVLAQSLNNPSCQVILPATHDTSSAITAIPAISDSYLYISSGTWSLVGVELGQPLITPETLAANINNEFIPEGRTSFLKIVPGMWLLQQCRADWRAQGKEYSYDTLTQMAAASPVHGAILDVTDSLFLPPGAMVSRIQSYCRESGQEIPQTEGEIVRCILESLAYLYRGLLEDFERVLKKHLDVIHIIGGGSRNQLLNQMAADVCGRTVISGPVEATAMGNILVQAMGLGLVGSVNEIRQVVHRSFEPITSHAINDPRWDEGYEFYRSISNKMKRSQSEIK